MHPELISRVITLVKKHGDRLVLADEQTGEAVVVLPLDAYERLVGAEVGRSPLVQQQQPPAQPAAPRQRSEAPQPRVQHEPAHESQRSRGLTTEEVMAKVGERVAPPMSPATPAALVASPVVPMAQPAPAAQDGRDDEERFYLEPIE
jgi:hypothetical protein